MASRRKDRKFRRHVRARMEKTGESYTTARLNLSKARTPSDAPQQVEKSLAERQERPSNPRLAIHRLLAEGRLKLAASPTPGEQATRKASLWARLEKEVKRVASPRQAAGLLEAFKKKGLDDEQLQNAIGNLGTLPTGFMRRLELIAEQARQLQPILEQASEIRDAVRQAQEMLDFAEVIRPAAIIKAVRDFQPLLGASRRALEELAAVPKISDEVAASIATARRLLDEVGAVPIRHLAGKDAVSAALRYFDTGPVAAAMRYLNESPVAAAIQHINEGPLAAKRRYNDPVKVALRCFEDDVASAALRFLKDSPGQPSVS